MGIYKKNENWWIDYYFYGKRKREKIGPSKRLAENVLRKRKVEIAENRYLDVKKNKRIKFEEFAKTFLELHSKPNKKSWKSDFYNFNNLIPFFGGRYLYEITSKDIEEYKAKRRENVSAATVNRDLATLKTMFTKAIEWGVLEDNPARNVKFLREHNRRLRYLEKEEIKRLIDSCSERLKPIVILALNTGMRRGEILKLKWRDLDFQKGIIYLVETKNNEKREVFMNELVKETLASIRKHPDSPYLFCDKEGKPYKDIRKSFSTALKKAGIMNFKFHDLRHTFASQLAMAGVDLNTIRELMGHRDIRMTLRYSHLSPEHKKRAVDALGHQMDTFWTLRDISKMVEESELTQPIENYRN